MEQSAARQGSLARLRYRLSSDRAIWPVSILAAAIAAYHYWRAVHPGVGPFLDSVEYQTTVATLGISHPPGYPLYLFLGRLFSLIPWGDRIAHFGDNPAFRLNMMSAAFAALTVAVVVHLIHRLTRNVVVAFLGGLTLAGAVRFWFQATYTEVYALFTFLVAITIYWLVVWGQTRRSLFYYLSVTSFSLSFGVNLSAVALLPAWLWSVLMTDKRMLTRTRHLAVTAAIVSLAAAQYLYVPLRALVFGPPPFCNYCPETWSEVPAFLSGQVWWTGTFGVQPQYWLQRWADSGYQLMLQFWPSGVMLGALGLGWLALRNWRIAGMFVLGLAATWFLAITYNVVDWTDFLTPVFVLYTPLIGAGMWATWEWLSKQLSGHPDIPSRYLVLGPGIFLAGLSAALLLATFRNNAPLVNQSENIHWQWWARDLLKQMEPDAWVLVPPTATDGFAQSWALRYVAWTEGLAPGMRLVFTPGLDPPGPEPGYLSWEKAEPDLANHPVYVVERNDDRLTRFALLPLNRSDGWTIGYKVVGERMDPELKPWVPEETWAAIADEVILP